MIAATFIYTYLTVMWTVLAAALFFGIIYSIWRIIPRREE